LKPELPQLDWNSLKTKEKVVAICHSRPDGDAIGSLLGWQALCRHYGISLVSVSPDPVPDFLTFLPGSKSIVVPTSEVLNGPESPLNGADLIVLLDFSRRNRCGEVLSKALDDVHCPIWCIDHHPEPEAFDTLFHNTSASSTCELIAGLVQGDCPTDAALCLMTGLLTDTGRFQFATTPHTFQMAGVLLKSNLDYRSLTDRLFEQESLEALRLRGFILKDKLVQHPNLPLAWIEINFQESQKLGLKPGATEGWVNFGLSIHGNKAAFLFHEKEAGITRISFRSKQGIAVNGFAEKYFQGGGHRYAAGGRFDDTSQKAVHFLLERVGEIFPL
jgi:phosphoesterase RecJ-like protein